MQDEKLTLIPEHPHHILYSFRRCPYAMRARMALYACGIPVELREVDLKDKPDDMLDISPKGTVPVLELTDGTVYEESLDIMEWALSQDDPQDWTEADAETTEFLISRNDGKFKKALDRYKYPNRYPNEDCDWARDAGEETLKDLNARLEKNGYLVTGKPTWADYAVFPFIRQFANTDRDWFDALPLPALQKWLEEQLESLLFKTIMQKFKPWTPGDPPVILAPLKQEKAL